MTTPRRPRRPRFRTRLTAVLLTSAGLVAAAGAVSPAHADVPVGWSDPAKVNVLHAFLLLGGVPLLLGLAIIAMVYAPSLARGERIAPGPAPLPADQWLGGPRRGTRELAAPDAENSQAGGARGTW